VPADLRWQPWSGNVTRFHELSPSFLAAIAGRAAPCPQVASLLFRRTRRRRQPFGKVVLFFPSSPLPRGVFRSSSYRHRATTVGPLRSVFGSVSPSLPELIWWLATNTAFETLLVAVSPASPARFRERPIRLNKAQAEPPDKLQGYNIGGVEIASATAITF